MTDHIDIHILIVSVMVAILSVMAVTKLDDMSLWLTVTAQLGAVLLFVTPMTLTRAFDSPRRDNAIPIVCVNLGLAIIVGGVASCVTFFL